MKYTQNFDNYPWKSRAVLFFAPEPRDVDRFCRFIEDFLVPDGIDTLVLIIRYNFMFRSHPECRSDDPLTVEDIHKMRAVCRRHGIELIPDMNLLGHQTAMYAHRPDSFLRAHPEFSEIPVREKQNIHWVLCPSHPDLFPILADLMDEVMDAFESKYFHFGCDEVFTVGACERCRGTDPGDLFANWVNRIAAHIKSRGVIPMMWGDRLLNESECHYGSWESSVNGTWTALGKVDTDIILCDWHYENNETYPSVEKLTEAGFKIYLCTFASAENAERFFNYAKAHDNGNILGIMSTTWMPCDFMMDGFEGKDLDRLENAAKYAEWTRKVVRCYDWIFRAEEFVKLPKPETEIRAENV